MKDTAICVFAKSPTPGTVKTRLHPLLGSQVASDLASAFLKDTLALTLSRDWADTILATTEMPPAREGLPEVEIWLQGDGDLGARLRHILSRALRSYRFVFAFGSDTPHIPSRYLDDARNLLEQSESVLGPSRDGGFYLLGLKRIEPFLFANIPWGTPDACTFMEERLRQHRFSVTKVAPWWDVDTPHDLDVLATHLLNPTDIAPHTRKFLLERGLLPYVQKPVLN